ncbi:ABC transporter permease [Oenococcus kitaharae]|uniref:ABC-type antimicrobial peptide transport system permease component n=1 Tax=Oenococcus kitaharae DSM 17330 TaxID=1045004 RepID=G9WIF2_9LACO|nr:ABC transporter permease [Oenococcus kitaharae]EHN58964.1 ABC-type antimicrobial peptide transport system permease component [Oenococcus kitaharae DSM 17330]
MDYIKRAFLYLRRRIGKSLLLILVTTTSLIAILTGLTIQNALLKSSENNKKPLGSTVILSSRQHQLTQRALSSGFDSTDFWSYPIADAGRAQVSRKIAKRLARLSNVASYQIHSQAQVEAASFRVPPLNTDSKQSATAKGLLSNNQVTIFGISANLDDPNFQAKKYSIIRGRGIYNSDLGSHNVVIERSLALEDDIDIGHIIKVRNSQNRVSSLKVVGIYTAKGANGHLFRALEDPSRTIFASYSLASNLAGNAGMVTQAAYTLANRQQEHAFIEKANQLIPSPLQLTSTDRLYRAVTTWIQALSRIALRFIWSAVIAGSLILFIILAVMAKTRQKEVCLLIALGEKKGKIAGQFFIETGLVLLISLILTGAFGNFFSSLIGAQIITHTAIFSTPLGISSLIILVVLGIIMVSVATGLSLFIVLRSKFNQVVF